MTKCQYALDLEASKRTDDPEVGPVTTAKAMKAEGYSTGPTSVKRHRKGTCLCAGKGRYTSTSTATTGGEYEEHNADGSASYSRFSDHPWGYDEYREFIRSKGQDPDKVTFTWGWTSNPTGGYWNKLNNVRPKPDTPEALVDFHTLRSALEGWTPGDTANDPSHPPVSLAVGLADWQIGKGEGDGTEGTLRRLAASRDRIQRDLDALESQGIVPEGLLLANLGDHTENVAGSYASQTYSVDLNMRDQINVAIDENLRWLKALAPRFKQVEYAACLCNHGQLSRGQGRFNVTDDADNATGLIGDQLRRLCQLHPALEHVRFNVPEDEMLTTTTMSGVNVAMAHGHKITGNIETWLAKQSQALTQRKRFIPDLWFTAHWHHAALRDHGPYTQIQATTSDPGSKHHLDTTGGYSRPGTTTFLFGADLPGHWDHYRIH